jgi:chromosome segregation ATPase
MARPLPTSDPQRGGVNGNYSGRLHMEAEPAEPAGADVQEELEHLRAENEQLRVLCGDLEQALQEAAQQADAPSWEERLREYEVLLEEKNEMIRQLHEQLTEAQATLEDAQGQAEAEPRVQGPIPREEELLALSEELERERRQLQEDEQALMEQMRQMEVSMARERAEMARQRNDLQRLYGEIRHELERLERNGALQSKIDGLKSKLQDSIHRRGAAPSLAGQPAPGTSAPSQPSTPPPAPSRKDSLMGRLFGKKD